MIPEIVQDVLCVRLRKHLDNHFKYLKMNIEIIPVGSVALGTWIGKRPDIDIFVLSNEYAKCYLKIRSLFPEGFDKKGELLIWHIPDYEGYPIDIVCADPINPRTQTIKHTHFYANRLSTLQKKSIRELKQFFKDQNLYGAEIGGITGIAITELINKYKRKIPALDILRGQLGWDISTIKLIDPTLPERNLLASILPFRRKRMSDVLIIMDGWGATRPPKVTSETMKSRYDLVYSFNKKTDTAIDRQFQEIYHAINASFRALKHEISRWKPAIYYDILFEDDKIHIGISITPHLLTEDRYDMIPVDVLNEEAISKILKKGGKYIDEGLVIKYPRKPPYKDVLEAYDNKLREQLPQLNQKA